MSCAAYENALAIRELAAETHRSKTLLNDLENGKCAPAPDVVDQLDGLLGAGGSLRRLQVRNPQDELMRESERFAQQLAATSDGELVTTLDRTTNELAVDYLTNPGAGLIDEVTTSRREAFKQMRARRLLNHHQVRYLTADVGYLSGILAYAALDDGQPGAALTHTDAAWEAARMAGSDQLKAWIRGTQSLILRFQQRYPEALAHAEDGLQYAGTGTARARLLAGVGQCYANMAEPRAVRRALNAAEIALDGQHGDDELGGLFTFSRAKLLYYSGSSLIWLDGGDDARRARDQAHTAIEVWEGGGSERSVADEALAHIYAATGALQLHELEQAMVDLEPILSLPAGNQISWIAKRMDRIDRILAEPPFNTDAQARDLRERIKAYG